jgi:hypothetical protein
VLFAPKAEASEDLIDALDSPDGQAEPISCVDVSLRLLKIGSAKKLNSRDVSS